jgi:hypothetical protein
MNRTMPMPSPETTDLERRVLAHERVLQALIAYMARTEPRFVDHLRERFVEPMSMMRSAVTSRSNWAKRTLNGKDVARLGLNCHPIAVTALLQRST